MLCAKRRNRKTNRIHFVWYCRACEDSFVTERRDEPLPIEEPDEKIFQRDWHGYNISQMEEFRRFQETALKFIKNHVKNQPRELIKGRPKASQKDMLLCCLLKIYFNRSSRRLISILKDAETTSLITKTPEFSTIMKYFNNPDMTQLLHLLIEETSKELCLVENSFSVDTTGFTCNMYRSWFNAKYEKPAERRIFKKVHAMVGNKTQIVSAVRITDGFAADTKQFPELLEATANNFKVSQVCGDKAYLSQKNFEIVEEVGGKPYIMFKEDSTHKGHKPSIWKKMYKEFCFEPEKYAAAYHQRSTIESAFSSIKRKFGERLFTKNAVAQENEILGKILCHNICVLTKTFDGR